VGSPVILYKEQTENVSILSIAVDMARAFCSIMRFQRTRNDALCQFVCDIVQCIGSHKNLACKKHNIIANENETGDEIRWLAAGYTLYAAGDDHETRSHSRGSVR
jgi:hypothetical protein